MKCKFSIFFAEEGWKKFEISCSEAAAVDALCGRRPTSYAIPLTSYLALALLTSYLALALLTSYFALAMLTTYLALTMLTSYLALALLTFYFTLTYIRPTLIQIATAFYYTRL